MTAQTRAAKNRLVRAVQTFDVNIHAMQWHSNKLSIMIAEFPLEVHNEVMLDLVNKSAAVVASMNMMKYKLLRRYMLDFPTQNLEEVEQLYGQALGMPYAVPARNHNI